MILEEGTKDQLLDCAVRAMTPQVGERWCYCYQMAVNGDWFNGQPFYVTAGMAGSELAALLCDNSVHGILVRLP